MLDIRVILNSVKNFRKWFLSKIKINYKHVLSHPSLRSYTPSKREVKIVIFFYFVLYFFTLHLIYKSLCICLYMYVVFWHCWHMQWLETYVYILYHAVYVNVFYSLFELLNLQKNQRNKKVSSKWIQAFLYIFLNNHIPDC